MSHPDTRHDPENVLPEDIDAQAEQEKINAYANARIMRRGDWESWYDQRLDLAPDGRNIADVNRMVAKEREKNG